MPLTMLLGALMLLRRSLWDLDPLERLRRANRQLRSVAFWRKDDRNPQPPPVEKVLRRAVHSSGRHSPFLQKRTVRMSRPITRRNRRSYMGRPTRRTHSPF